MNIKIKGHNVETRVYSSCEGNRLVEIFIDGFNIDLYELEKIISSFDIAESFILSDNGLTVTVPVSSNAINDNLVILERHPVDESSITLSIDKNDLDVIYYLVREWI